MKPDTKTTQPAKQAYTVLKVEHIDGADRAVDEVIELYPRQAAFYIAGEILALAAKPTKKKGAKS